LWEGYPDRRDKAKADPDSGPDVRRISQIGHKNTTNPGYPALMNMQLMNVTAPPTPHSLAGTGLGVVMMRDILLKTMFRQNLERVSNIARAICLPIALTQELVDHCRSQRLLEATGTLRADAGPEMGFHLTEAGKARALDALSQSEYYGPMPVPLEMFKEQTRRQSIRNIRLTRERLIAAMGHLILPERLLDHLGPAVTSGRSILMYGPPGNGKSSIANGICDALGDTIYVPHCIEYAGQVITLYDPIVHTRAPQKEYSSSSLRRRQAGFDTRYVLCERPTVITGGELTLSMLDLTYNANARTYQASLQLKSTGGVFIVDDLGRQKDSAQALINRWIVPMEEGYDILTLQSGEKFLVPFDTLVIFSTNFHPNEMFDRAALRRIFYKIRIDGPTKEQFLKIFSMVARQKKMLLNETTLAHLLEDKYPKINNEYANYHPGFLIDQMISVCNFEGLPYRMTPELLDRAWDNMFVSDDAIAH